MLRWGYTRLGRALGPTTDILRRGEDTQRQGERLCEDRGRDGRAQPQARIAGIQQELGRGKEGFFPRAFQRDSVPDHTLIAHFWPPGLRENKACCFEPQSVRSFVIAAAKNKYTFLPISTHALSLTITASTGQPPSHGVLVWHRFPKSRH